MVVPEGWEVRNLAHITLDLVRGPFGGALKKDIFIQSGYRVYEQQDAIYGKKAKGRYFIDLDKYNELSRFAVTAGDFIVSCSGTIGKIYQLPYETPAGVINQALLKIKLDETQIISQFFLQYFKWRKFQQSITDDIQGGAMKNIIGMDKFKLTQLLLPPLPEQLRIAEVLSDTDSYITTLERLIAKKEAVKQGVMQELLTGKRRLPGFKGEWVEKRLENIVKVYDSLRIPVTEAQREKGSYPYYGANGILDYVKGYTHEGEFVLLAEDGANDLLNYPVIYVNGRVWVNNHTHVITGLAGIANTRFLSYALKIIRFQHLVVGGTRCKLNSSIMSKIIISIPPTLAEQTAIAEILSDMDAELSALKKKLEKIRLIKQGMMDALLTGKIRLPEDKPNVQFTQRKEQEEILYAAEKTEGYTAKIKEGK